MTPEAQDVPRKLEQILSELLARPIDESEDDETPLRELGLSSLRMIQLIDDLETAFSIRVQDREVTGANFGTLATLIAFVGGKIGSRP
ncbi:MAG: acyl carrier protein [Candidatus Eisenbacteria bacterium]|uniref:Acyl carrier protein n=1 Tax=Eiseniibacteriota bacterium TaxID=2212470 RepID=A0A956RPF8_UNCEI|nr:acyl carrier protein [Candidatus Eisenbacteria bacterium]